MFTTRALTLLACALTLSVAFAAKRDKRHEDAFIPGDANESRIAREVRHQLVMLPYYGVFDDLAFSVNDGTVTLLGAVTRPTLKSDAENVVKRIEGVTQVINKIEVENARDLGQMAQDEYLARMVWAKLFVDRGVRANNYSVECIDNVVYLIGVGQDKDEVQRVVDHARDVAYVRAVENYVRVKTDPLLPEPPPPAKAPEILPAESQPGLDPASGDTAQASGL